jgi:hypothetical protein
MPDPEHQDKRFGIHNLRDDAVVPRPVSPKFAETIALQRLTDRTRIIEGSDPVAKEAKNAAAACESTLASSTPQPARTQFSTP